jgi:hypothetical protein
MGKHPGALKQILQSVLFVDRVMEPVRGGNRDQAFVGSGQCLGYDHRMFVPVLIPALGTEIPVGVVPDFYERVVFGGQQYGIAKAHLAAPDRTQIQGPDASSQAQRKRFVIQLAANHKMAIGVEWSQGPHAYGV